MRCCKPSRDCLHVVYYHNISVQQTKDLSNVGWCSNIRPSLIENLDSGLTAVRLYNGRGAQVVVVHTPMVMEGGVVVFTLQPLIDREEGSFVCSTTIVSDCIIIK